MEQVSETTVVEQLSQVEKEIVKQINNITEKINAIIEYRQLSRIKKMLTDNPQKSETVPTIRAQLSLIQQTKIREISDEKLKDKILNRIIRINSIIE